MSQQQADICEQTTINELADIVRDMEQSMTIRIYDDNNEVIGAIRLVHVDEIQQIDHMRSLQQVGRSHLH
ncbi:MAG TPA: hypothetical protein DE179_10615 [Oceanospirillaceae bacterium]|nr:hypothetical protein [Oceanospirillaceae bacterium]